MNADGSLVYRVAPGCGATSVGQLFHYGQVGSYCAGDLHDGAGEFFRWTEETHRPPIHEAVATDRAIRFFSVRNPFSRCLSAFFDTVLGPDPRARPYRDADLGGDYALYRIRWEDLDPAGGADAALVFQRFMLMVWDSNQLKRPHEADMHWYPISYLCRPFVQQGRPFHDFVAVESFADDIARLLERTDLAHPPDLAALPAFDAATGLSHVPDDRPVEAYFDTLTTWIVHQVFWHDFNLFGYDWTPGDGPPLRRPSMAAVNGWFFNG